MGRITTFEEQLRNPSTVNTARVDARALPGAALAQGLAGTADAVGRAADLAAKRDIAQAEAVRSQRLGEARLQAMAELSDLRLRYENDADPTTMRERWRAETDQLFQRHVENFGRDKGLAGAFEQDFRQWQLRDQVDIAGIAGKKISKRGRAQLEAGLDTLSGLLARAGDDTRAQQIQDLARVSIADATNAGYVDAVEAGEMQRQFLGRADEARLRGLIVSDPEAALLAINDPEAFADLDEIKRTQLTDMATRRVDSLRSDRIRLAEKAERDAEKTLAKAREQVEMDLWSREADGTLGRDEIEAARQSGALGTAGYKALLAAIEPKDDPARDDVDTVARLETMVDAADIAGEATEAYRAGQIRKETFTRLIDKNRQLRADDLPDSPYKSARELVKITLDPGQLLSGAAAQVARSGQAQALVEFDNWAAAHPQATRAEAQAEAQNTVQRYQIIAYQEMSLATGLPRFYDGGRGDLSFGDLDAAEGATIDALDAGRLTREQADQELRKIESWRAILTAKPAGSQKGSQP